MDDSSKVVSVIALDSRPLVIWSAETLSVRTGSRGRAKEYGELSAVFHEALLAGVSHNGVPVATTIARLRNTFGVAEIQQLALQLTSKHARLVFFGGFTTIALNASLVAAPGGSMMHRLFDRLLLYTFIGSALYRRPHSRNNILNQLYI